WQGSRDEGPSVHSTGMDRETDTRERLATDVEDRSCYSAQPIRILPIRDGVSALAHIIETLEQRIHAGQGAFGKLHPLDAFQMLDLLIARQEGQDGVPERCGVGAGAASGTTVDAEPFCTVLNALDVNHLTALEHAKRSRISNGRHDFAQQ